MDKDLEAIKMVIVLLERDEVASEKEVEVIKVGMMVTVEEEMIMMTTTITITKTETEMVTMATMVEVAVGMALAEVETEVEIGLTMVAEIEETLKEAMTAEGKTGEAVKGVTTMNMTTDMLDASLVVAVVDAIRGPEEEVEGHQLESEIMEGQMGLVVVTMTSQGMIYLIEELEMEMTTTVAAEKTTIHQNMGADNVRARLEGMILEVHQGKVILMERVVFEEELLELTVRKEPYEDAQGAKVERR